jgi:ABC-2 type transport system ATP-binding protein
MSVISVQNLKKHFGNAKAVDDISFSVEKGEIFGFLGPNGAGKTTTIRCLMNFIWPTAGNISVLGLDAQTESAELKNKIGYLPGNVKLYDSWTGKEHIEFISDLRGGKKESIDLVDKLDFNPKIKTKHLSTGNRQKLGLIMALMHKPEIVILDEPTVGLDPLLQNAIYDILEEMQKKGTTILMSSHNLPEVERLCSRVGIIKEGKLIAQENVNDLYKKKIHHVKISIDGKFNINDFLISDVEIEEELSDGLVLAIRGDINKIVERLTKYTLKDIEISHATLEEIFLEFYKKEN